MGKYDSLVYVGGALGALYLFRKQISDALSGIGKVTQGAGTAVSGVGTGVSSAAIGTGQLVGTVTGESAETFKLVSDQLQDFIRYESEPKSGFEIMRNALNIVSPATTPVNNLILKTVDRALTPASSKKTYTVELTDKVKVPKVSDLVGVSDNVSAIQKYLDEEKKKQQQTQSASTFAQWNYQLYGSDKDKVNIKSASKKSSSSSVAVKTAVALSKPKVATSSAVQDIIRSGGVN